MNPFAIIAVYLRLYAFCVRQAARGIAKSPWTLLLPMLLVLVLMVASLLLGALPGGVGGFVIGFVLAALYSSYLYFVSETVQQAKVSIREWRKSALAHFWGVMNVLFILYITDLMLGYALASNPNAGLVTLGISLIELVLLSAVPEVLYQRNAYGMGSILESVKFVQENWIEWFVPHGVLGAAVYFGAPTLFRALLTNPLLGLLSSLPVAVLGGALLHFFMVFRGHLFEVLSSSSHRQRMFRFRSPGTAGLR